MSINNITDVLDPDNIAADKEEGFKRWLNRDEIRMLLASIPESSNNDVFMGLLQTAFKSGYDNGQARFGLAVVKDIFSLNTKRKE